VAFVGAEEIRRVNYKYRGKDYVTDVLSFTEEEFLKRKKLGKLEEKEFLGELLICPRQVKIDAQNDNVCTEKETAWVIIHGILHLFGEDHEAGADEAARMRKKEQEYLLKLKNLF
jgi:probable rRNA maturation factor